MRQTDTQNSQCRFDATPFRGVVWALVVLQLLFVTAPALAQSRPGDEEYRFKVGDRIYLTVPDRPALNREMQIADNGSVTIPLIGEVPVVGLTAEEMRGKVWEALHELYPSISREEVAIEAMLSWIVYVSGEVAEPGRYTFTNRPNLWQAIREAGGPTAEAALGDVRIVEDESRGGGSRVIDVLSALERGSVDRLPQLNEGDTVVIPSQDEAYTGAFGVNVYGAVQTPGVYRLTGRQDLASAVLLAGGPTDRADLDSVKIVRPNDGGYTTIKVDLKRHLDTGDPASNPPLRAGDTINVPEQNALKYQVTNNITVITSVLATAATITLLYIRLSD
jgi:protein involved in polysaccharide export with SLBB domain